MYGTKKHSCGKLFDSPAPLPYDKGRYYIRTMSGEGTPKSDDRFGPEGALEVAEDDLLDIDPADVVDSEEFVDSTTGSATLHALRTLITLIARRQACSTLRNRCKTPHVSLAIPSYGSLDLRFIIHYERAADKDRFTDRGP